MLKTYFDRSISLFFISGFLFIPLTFLGVDYQSSITQFFFTKPVAFIQHNFFANTLTRIDFSSDTIGLNILLCLLLAIAFLVVLSLNFLKINSAKLVSAYRSLSAYYIAMVLLKYGFDKIFKQQFYLPEPNILYATFGSLTKDILFWSTIGLSHTYSVVTGAIEVLTALLIIIKPTRILGFCVAAGVLINILLINFSFDISVKTFVSFLLAVVIFNIYPYLRILYTFFVQHKQTALPLEETLSNGTKKLISRVLGIGLICCILLPYILAGNYNDDNAERPLLHGAYEITRFIVNNDTLKSGDFPYKKVFIHRDNYIIFQQKDDVMIDYFFTANPAKDQLQLQDYKNNKIIVGYNYDIKTGELQLKFNNAQKWGIESKSLNWKALPALQNDFHYTIDEIK